MVTVGNIKNISTRFLRQKTMSTLLLFREDVKKRIRIMPVPHTSFLSDCSSKTNKCKVHSSKMRKDTTET